MSLLDEIEAFAEVAAKRLERKLSHASFRTFKFSLGISDSLIIIYKINNKKSHPSKKIIKDVFIKRSDEVIGYLQIPNSLNNILIEDDNANLFRVYLNKKLKENDVEINIVDAVNKKGALEYEASKKRMLISELINSLEQQEENKTTSSYKI